VSAPMKTARELVHEAVRRADKRGCCNLPACAFRDETIETMLCDELTAAILAALTEMREACAREADAECPACRKVPTDFGRMYHQSCREARAAAARIRAMEVK
jgi:hypothetical protein